MNARFGLRHARIAAAAVALAASGWSIRAAETARPPGAVNTAVAEDDGMEEEDEYALPKVRDPFERYNRTIFKFNDSVYRRVVRPVAKGYEAVVPSPVRRGLKSFFDNIRFPVRFASCLLQGKVDRAAAETGKFLVNSTVGVAGFIKASDNVPELIVPEEDLGQAFGVWGIGAGPFVVLPVLGPTNFRDMGGWVGDYMLTPTNWNFTESFTWEVRDGVVVVNSVNELPELVESYEAFRRMAIDPYVSFRNGYLQYREAAIRK